MKNVIKLDQAHKIVMKNFTHIHQILSQHGQSMSGNDVAPLLHAMLNHYPKECLTPLGQEIIQMLLPKIKGTFFEEMIFPKAKRSNEDREDKKLDLFLEGVFCFTRNMKGPRFSKKYERVIQSLGGVL